jgi:hypothetical protein
MSSGGKGGQQTQSVKLPGAIKNQAKDNLKLAQQVGSLPYAPYFGGSVAAFTPAQHAGFGNMNEAASAFGLQGRAGMGLPKAESFGGVPAYSTEGVYKDAMSEVDPKVLELYQQFFYPNKPGSSAPAPQMPQVRPMAPAPSPMAPAQPRASGPFK